MMVGILGAGQLARMLALAGYPLGLRFAFLDPSEDACAFPLGEPLCGAYDKRSLIEKLAEQSAVVTYEFENVPARSGQILAERVPVYPPAKALAVKQDRYTEKQLFAELGIPTPKFLPVDDWGSFEQAVGQLGLPLVVKTRSLGYDGKGQFIVRGEQDFRAARGTVGTTPLLAEQYVEFRRELSVIAVRGRTGETAFYPISENVHAGGILRFSRCRNNDAMANAARDYAAKLMTRLDYVGVLALELFEQASSLLANEFAPRVHNSGHWTIEGAECSQFENHLRAILGYPLGDTSVLGEVGMVNCVGELPDPMRVLAVRGVHLHTYGKPARAGRKIGHITVRAAEGAELCRRMRAVCESLSTECVDEFDRTLAGPLGK